MGAVELICDTTKSQGGPENEVQIQCGEYVTQGAG